MDKFRAHMVAQEPVLGVDEGGRGRTLTPDPDLLGLQDMGEGEPLGGEDGGL